MAPVPATGPPGTPKATIRASCLGAVVLAGALVAAGPAVAGAVPPSGATLRAALSAWTSSHRQTSALVWRLDRGGPRPILAYRPDVPRRPASTMKVVTAAGALIGLGPSFRFETRLYAGAGAVRRGRVLHGPLYLVGGGDPVLATPAYSRRFLGGRGTNLGRIVRPLRSQDIRLVRGPIVADESVLDARRRGPRWKSSYRFECPPLSGLSVNENFAGDWQGGYVPHPPLAAAERLRQVMRALGVRHVGSLRTGRAPGSARLVASVGSPPLSTIVALMNRDSDNFIAETLVKDVGSYRLGRGSTAAGTAANARRLRERGILGPGDRLVDGSGLSRDNRLTASSLVRLLAAADADPTWGRALIESLARGGQGTLRRRFTSPAVAGRVRAKTGYISGVSSLAGVVTSVSGARYAFALLMNDWDIAGARATQDRVVALLAQGAGDRLAPLPG